MGAAGRPGGRNDGLGTGQGGLGVLAVRVRDPQVVAAARLGDIGHARGKSAGRAGQLLVNPVGQAVGRQTQVGRRHGVPEVAFFLAFDRVPQTGPHVVTAIGQAGDRTGHQGLGRHLPPGRPIGSAQLVHGGGARVQPLELAAALQIGLHDAGQLVGRRGFALERHDHHGQLGRAHARDFHPKLRPGRRGQGAA